MPTNGRWEYKLLTYKLGWKGFTYDQIEQDLNELGAQGWEAVSTLSPTYGQGQSMDVTMVLKRGAG